MTTERKALIEVEETNLYSNGRVIDLGNNELQLTRTPLDLSQEQKPQYHTVGQGDELTALAYKYYGEIVGKSGRLWWVIADANPEIRNVLDLTPFVGKNIIIPDWPTVKLMI